MKTDNLIPCAGPPAIRVPPRFQDTAIFEKGEEVVIKIPFTGFPKPSVKWLRGENEIKNSDKYKVEVGDRHAILTIRNSDRMDDGPYRLELDNDLGTDSAIIKIAINGTIILGFKTHSCVFLNREITRRKSFFAS